MCVILVGKTKDIKKLPLHEAWETNPHGAGLVIPSKSMDVVKGIMKLKELENILTQLPDKQTICLHLRQATHGSINKNNTHPFAVESHSYLMHNGILYGLGKAGHGGYSDSAHLARILSKLKPNDRHAVLNSLSGKFALITRNEIKLFGQFEREHNVQMSNTYWMSSMRVPRYYFDSPRTAERTGNGSIWTRDKGTMSAKEINQAIDLIPDDCTTWNKCN